MVARSSATARYRLGNPRHVLPLWDRSARVSDHGAPSSIGQGAGAALFVGFVVPGETAAIIGGVLASRGHVELWLTALVVVVAAIIGDSVGYEVGRHLGTRLLNLHIFDKRRKRLDDAQDFLRRRGGAAVFLGRFVAFFRAVMPALAGTSRMPYLKFLAFNGGGGMVGGVGFTLLGSVAGTSYQQVPKTAGPYGRPRRGRDPRPRRHHLA